VLLIACGNVASLQLARVTEREDELTVRAALGASRRALVRLLFSESILLAAAGGALGILTAFVALRGLQVVLPPEIPRIESVRIDGLALLFALATSTVAALVFGILPALMASRTDLASGLKEGGYGTRSPHKERLRDHFIVGQIALGLILVNGATLLVRNYTDLRSQDQGFESEGVLTAALSPNGPRYETQESRLRFYEELTESARAVPGVSHAGVVSKLPLSGGTNGNIWVEGTAPRSSIDEGPLVEVSSVSGEYFSAMGIPLLKGRTLIADDSASSAPGVLINQALADEAWPDEDPIGKRFSFDDNPPQWLTVVGVAGNVRQWGPERPALSEVYFPYAQGWSSSANIVVAVAGDPVLITRQLRAALLSVDPSQPPSAIQLMDDRVERAFARRRFSMTLIGLFAIAALFLAAAGIYGTVSYFVTRRSKELGIRIALGADAPGIAKLVLSRGARLAVAGIAVGLVGVWATTSLVESLLYNMEAIDVTTLLIGCLVLGSVTIVACVLPARKAIKLPPTLVLRSK
jgi:putative ABC transport system permease protein